MSIYDELKPVVQELFDEFQQGTIQLVKVTPGAGPIDDPGEPTEVEHTLQAVVSGVSFKFVRDGLAVASDLFVRSAPVEGVVVDEKDFIKIDSVRYKIVHDASVPAAGDKLVWKLIVRKGK